MRKTAVSILSLFTFALVGLLAFLAVDLLVFSENTPGPKISDYFYPANDENLLINDPPVYAGVMVQQEKIFIGEEFLITLVVVYPEKDTEIIRDGFLRVLPDPFEVRALKITEGDIPLAHRKFLAVVYTVQCASCVPGFEYSTPNILLAVKLRDRGTFPFQIAAVPSTLRTAFLYDKDDTALRGIKDEEELTVSESKTFLLIGGGVMLSIAGLVGGGVALARRVFRRKQRIADPAVEEFQNSLALFEKRLREEDADTRGLMHGIYVVVGRLVFKKNAVDIMDGQDLLPVDLVQCVRELTDLCECAYDREIPKKDAVGLALEASRRILGYYARERGG